jgi:hypothetical protein
MPVQETADGIEQLHKAGLPVGGVVVNLARPKALDDEAIELTRAGGLNLDFVAADLTRVGIDATPELLAHLADEAADHAERRLLEDEQRARVAQLQRPTYELPRLAYGVDLGGLYELAAQLGEQAMA